MDLRKTVGKNIRERRKQLGWTQEKLAGASKLTSDYLCALENGKVNVSIDAVGRLAKSLGVEPKDLFS